MRVTDRVARPRAPFPCAARSDDATVAEFGRLLLAFLATDNVTRKQVCRQVMWHVV